MTFRFPLVKDLLARLFKRPLTNPFPAAHLPPSVSGLLDEVAAGRAQLNPTVPVPDGARFCLGYDPALCIGCQLCTKVCPAHAIEFLKEKRKVRVYLGQCVSCGQCVDVCAKKALAMNGNFLKSDTDRFSSALVLE